ncbi:MAG: adenylate cyclase [Chitinophagaceae bacterium]
MAHLNVEIKAKCSNPDFIRNFLKEKEAAFKGLDHQTDTYFNTRNGRLKLRQGNIENNLIYYERNNQAGPKSSHFNLIKIEEADKLKSVLAKAMGIKIVVEKKREIWFIDNVKFHIDEVPGLGAFVEIEASNLYADKTKEELLQQCNYYLQEFEIRESDLVEVSYSDMMLSQVNAK